MSPTKTEYKHIYFTEAEAKSIPAKDKESWFCRNNKTDGVLAEIAWYKPFRRWSVVQFNNAAAFDASCLRDITHFLDQLNKGD